MSVQIAPLNYSAHVWSPASWGDLDGFQGLLGVGAPSRTPKPDFSPAGTSHTRRRTSTVGSTLIGTMEAQWAAPNKKRGRASSLIALKSWVNISRRPRTTNHFLLAASLLAALTTAAHMPGSHPTWSTTTPPSAIRFLYPTCVHAQRSPNNGGGPLTHWSPYSWTGP